MSPSPIQKPQIDTFGLGCIKCIALSTIIGHKKKILKLCPYLLGNAAGRKISRLHPQRKPVQLEMSGAGESRQRHPREKINTRIHVHEKDERIRPKVIRNELPDICGCYKLKINTNKFVFRNLSTPPHLNRLNYGNNHYITFDCFLRIFKPVPML